MSFQNDLPKLHFSEEMNSVSPKFYFGLLHNIFLDKIEFNTLLFKLSNFETVFLPHMHVFQDGYKIWASQLCIITLEINSSFFSKIHGQCHSQAFFIQKLHSNDPFHDTINILCYRMKNWFYQENTSLQLSLHVNLQRIKVSAVMYRYKHHHPHRTHLALQ